MIAMRMKKGAHTVPTRRRPKRALILLTLLVVATLAGGVTLVYANSVPNYDWYTQDPEADVFSINTAGELAALSDLVAGLADTDGDGYPEEAMGFKDKTIQLGGNISFFMTGVDFYPIGAKDTPFEGTFDGNGKTISYLSLTEGNDPSDPYAYVGIFGYAGEDSLIKNVTLEDSCKVTIANNDTDKTIRYVGALVGYSEGDIDGCISRVAIDVSWDDGNGGDERTKESAVIIDSVAGVAGVCNGDITDTSFTGSLEIDTPANAYFDSGTQSVASIIATYVGGVVGRSGGDIDTAGQGVHGDITGCTNSGDITVYTTGEGGTDRFGQKVSAKTVYIGGIAGYAIGGINACVNNGDILATSYITNATDENTANSIYGDEATRKLYIADGGGSAVGGIVGSLRGNQTYNNAGTVGATDPGLIGREATGSADEIAITDCINTGLISALNNVADICGVSGTYTTISRCVNGDAVKSARDEWCGRIRSTRWNKPCTGGIAGQSFGVISYCRNHAEIETTQGGYYTGGIVGYTSYFTDATNSLAHPEPEMFACYNTGQVHSNILNNSDSMNREGSLIGGNSGYIHDCLFLFGTVNKSDDPLNAAIGENYGTYARCEVVFASRSSANQYGDQESIVLTSAAATAHLNAMAFANGFAYYYLTNANVNKGYPVLDTEASADGIVDLNALNPSVVVARDATYTAAANPTPEVRVTVIIDGSPCILTENADYMVLGDEDALDSEGVCKGVTAVGDRPYMASIKGIGAYSGLVENRVSYGITKGNFGECTLSAATVSYEMDEGGDPVAQNEPKVTIVDAAGGMIPTSDYTYVVNDNNECAVPGAYTVVANAAEISNYIGYVKGIYTIKKVDLARECDTVGLVYQGRVWLFDETISKLYEVELEDGATELASTYDEETGLYGYNIKGFEYYREDPNDSLSRLLTRATPRKTEDGQPVYGMSATYTGARIEPTVIDVLYRGSKLTTGAGQGLPDFPDWIPIYGAGGDLSVTVPNVEASVIGAVTVRYGDERTTNYVVMTFDIEPVDASDNDIAVTQERTSFAYNGGESIDTPVITVTYKGNVVDGSNYELIPAYSLAGAEKHEGSAMTYDVGDSLFYKLVFKESGSIVCDAIEDIGPWTILDGQKDINDCTAEVESPMIYTFAGVRRPELELYSPTGELLVEGTDYYIVRYANTAKPDKGSIWSKPAVLIMGINDYAGVKQVKFTILQGTVTSDTFTEGSESYVSMHAECGTIGNCYSGTIGLPEQTGFNFAYRVNGYSKDSLGYCIGFVWLSDKDYSGHKGIKYEYGSEYSNYLPPFLVASIKDAAGDEVDVAREPGTYTITLVANPEADLAYFIVDPDFSYTCEMQIRPVNLSAHIGWIDESTGVEFRYEQYDALSYYLYRDNGAYDETVYPYTGNPVVLRMRLLDSQDFFAYQFRPADYYYSHAFDTEDYDIYIEGYGTTGPVEVGTGYTVYKVAAAEGSEVLTGSVMVTQPSALGFGRTFDIVPADISDDDTVHIEVASAYYTGSAVTPEVSFWTGGSYNEDGDYVGGERCSYLEGSDYSLSYSNNVNRAEAASDEPPTVSVNILDNNHLAAKDADGNTVYSVSVPFSIEAAPTDLGDASVCTWNLGDTVSLAEGSTTLVKPYVSGEYKTSGNTTVPIPDVIYRVEMGSYSEGAFTPQAEGWQSGDLAYVRLTSSGTNPDFIGSVVLGPISVISASAENSFSGAGANAMSIASISSQVYTGEQLTPDTTVTDGAKTLLEGRDYLVTYGENLQTATGGTVTFSGMGAYTGSATRIFGIIPVRLSDCTITVADRTYTGTQVTPSASDVSVSLSGKTLPEEDWQLDVSGFGTNISVGSSNSLKIVAGTSGNLEGSATASFRIVPIVLTSTNTSIAVSPLTYTGNVLKPAAESVTVTDTSRSVVLAYGTDYTVSVMGAINAGTAVVYVSGRGNYTSTVASVFAINAADISTASVSTLSDRVYTGKAIRQDPLITWTNRVLEKAEDYTLSYSDNIDVGTAKMEAEGIGNFAGGLSATFQIASASLEDAVFDIDDTYSYTGRNILLDGCLSLGGVVLPEGDYTLSYSPDGFSEGIQTVTATAASANVTGSVSATFEITKADISLATVASVPDQHYAYGSAVTPSPVITSPAGDTLVQGEDYGLSYDNNTEIGTADVIITGMGSWQGSSTVSFNIIRIPITSSDIAFDEGSSFAYTGEAIIPALSIIVEGRTLNEGTDYELRFLGDRTSTGTQAIEITTPVSSVYASGITVTYQIETASSPKATSLEGASRYGTAAAIALEAYPEGAGGVVVSTGQNFPDALAAAGLAGIKGYPLLMVTETSVPQETRDALTRLLPQEIILIGGTNAVSDSVASMLSSIAPVTRISGASRYDTALAIYQASEGSWSSTAIIATGKNFPDALAISPYAAWAKAPIFLVGDDLSEGVADALRIGSFTRVVIVGGTSAVSASVEAQVASLTGSTPVRLGGSGRYETGALIAQWCMDQGMSFDGCGIATGVNFPDALAGGPLLGKYGSVLLLIQNSNMTILDKLNANKESINTIRFLGGLAAVPMTVRQAAVEALGWSLSTLDQEGG